MNRRDEKRTIQVIMWNLLTDLRGQIDGWDFKNYSLTMIFYKFLSEDFENYVNDNEEKAGNKGFKFSEIDDEKAMKMKPIVLKLLGYYINPSELFCNIHKNASTNANLNITIKNAFNNIQESTIGTIAEDNIKGIFDDFDVSSSKLGKDVKDKNETLKKLINCIASLDFGTAHSGLISDTFGDMYEYLMGMYAKNAGKSGGEYFTPPEVSTLLSRVAMIGKKEIKNIYDPTCGSGSLLLKSAKIIGLKNIRNGFYGQEKNNTTYNLCRENMMLHNVPSDMMHIKNGDTLSTPMHKSEKFEIIVSNPPYSVKWDVNPLTISDERFSSAGVTAPFSKADFAFLQHIIYQLEPNGVAGVVLPHGPLFRGGAEGLIRKYFIENNYIDTIISLPANLFYGTGIPTIIMILKKERANSDILFVDASKCFEKDKNQNVLRDADIEKIYDAVEKRKDISNFAKLIEKSEIIQNDYNLNIPRYITSDEVATSDDLYSLMTGKISDKEIKTLDAYWDNFPGLKEKIFSVDSEFLNYYKFNDVDIKTIVNKDDKVKIFNEKLQELKEEYKTYLKDKLIKNMKDIDDDSYDDFKCKLFEILSKENLIDVYENFQILADNYKEIYNDILLIKLKGLDVCKQSEPNMIKKTVRNKTTEIQNGFVGTIIPFDLVKDNYLIAENKLIEKLQKEADEQNGIYSTVLDSLDDDLKLEVCKLTKEGDLVEDNLSFDLKRVNTYLKTNENEDIENAKAAIQKEKELLKQIKEKTLELDDRAKEKLEVLTADEINVLLEKKWIDPIVDSISDNFNTIVAKFIKQLLDLKSKYSSQLSTINEEIKETENELSAMLDELTSDDANIKAIEMLKSLLG